jgi:CheY-like chemotaxis protein
MNSNMDEARRSGWKAGAPGNTDGRRGNAAGPLVLVVEDDADTRALYGILLEDAGFRFVAARHGEQALIMAGDLQPDVILADIGLPGPGDGCWMVRFLKTDPSTSRIPVIGVSGTDPADPQGWADFQTVLIKPVLPDHFVDVLRAALARQEET